MYFGTPVFVDPYLYDLSLFSWRWCADSAPRITLEELDRAPDTRVGVETAIRRYLSLVDKHQGRVGITMRIACLQFAPQVGRVSDNIARADAILSEADPDDLDGLDLLVLPELAFSGMPRPVTVTELPADVGQGTTSSRQNTSRRTSSPRVPESARSGRVPRQASMAAPSPSGIPRRPRQRGPLPSAMSVSSWLTAKVRSWPTIASPSCTTQTTHGRVRARAFMEAGWATSGKLPWGYVSDLPLFP